jgi:hypothetical protein
VLDVLDLATDQMTAPPPRPRIRRAARAIRR